jgi:hypothetical protein
VIENYREDGNVKQRVLCNSGMLGTPIAEQYKRRDASLRGEAEFIIGKQEALA